MEQELALKLFETGGVLILLDVPVGTELGIDFKTWKTDVKFHGFKMIPPGIHFVFYSATCDLTDEIAPRSGFFHNFHAGEVVVRKWDAEFEEIRSGNFVENVRNFDEFLAPYPFEVYEKWKKLTGNISFELVRVLEPECGVVRSALELQGCSDAERPRNSIGTSIEINKNTPEDALLPEMNPVSGTELRLTKFPKKAYPEGATPGEITQHSLDSSYKFEKVIEASHDILGELEFTFICFLIGHSLEAFEHWKKLVSLFCSCEIALVKHRKLYNDFLNILRVQIVEIPEEFLADIVTNNNFFYVKIRSLWRNVRASNIDGNFVSKTRRFTEFLSAKYGWEFVESEDETGEDAPVIVVL